MSELKDIFKNNYNAEYMENEKNCDCVINKNDYYYYIPSDKSQYCEECQRKLFYEFSIIFINIKCLLSEGAKQIKNTLFLETGEDYNKLLKINCPHTIKKIINVIRKNDKKIIKLMTNKNYSRKI